MEQKTNDWIHVQNYSEFKQYIKPRTFFLSRRIKKNPYQGTYNISGHCVWFYWVSNFPNEYQGRLEPVDNTTNISTCVKYISENYDFWIRKLTLKEQKQLLRDFKYGLQKPHVDRS